MKKLITTIFVLLFISSLTFSQKKNFTTKDIIFNSYTTLAPSRVKQLKWIPNSNAYSFIKDEGEKFILMKSYATSNKQKIIISLESLNKKIASLDLTAPARFPFIKWNNSHSFEFRLNKSLLKYDTYSKKLSIENRININASNIQVADNNKFVAFTIGNNLFVALDTNKTKQITDDSNTGIVNGQIVSRNEFGINKGIFWSPKSNYIAFYRKDQTGVTDYPILNVNTRPATVKFIKYPMAGMTSEIITIGIYNIKTGKTIWLNTNDGQKYQYLTCVTWGPEEKYIYVAILNRDQNHLKLIKFNSKNGEPVKTLFEETNKKYVHPQHPLVFLPHNKNEFLWRSERDGWDHLYLYNTDGNLIRKVTNGNWVVTSFDGFDNSGKNIFVTTTKESPVERHYYKINLKTAKIRKLTKGHGIHFDSHNSKGNFIIDRFNSLKVPGITRVLNSDGKIVKVIHKSKNPIADYNVGKIRIFTIKSKNNIDLYSRMITPPNFDPAKKYPVIVYVYGGPGVQIIYNTWPIGRYSFWFQSMAEKGYIIFTLDNRGSANRGLAFEQVTFRHLGTIEIQDQMQGVKYLKSLSYVDSNRFGVYGWSYGGFMATSLMLRTNHTFKVAVGGGAVINWKYYEVMYTERYMDTPQANPEGYKESNLLNYVKNLKGKLLLVHGTSDSTVVWQHTLMFAKKCTDLDKPLDYFPYVGHPHGVYGIDALQLYNKITNYFLDNL